MGEGIDVWTSAVSISSNHWVDLWIFEGVSPSLAASAGVLGSLEGMMVGVQQHDVT